MQSLNKTVRKDIIFLNPPVRPEERYGRFAGLGSFFPPLGLCSLASVCEKNGFSTMILDAEAKGFDFDQCLVKILEVSPRFLGITSTTMSVYNAARIARLIKNARPDITTIIGGVHVTSLPEETMKRFPDFDIGVLGEGEIVVVKLLDALMNNRGLDSVEGIIYRNNKEMKIRLNNAYISNLDQLPKLRWDLLDGFPGLYSPAIFSVNRTPAAVLVSSRGCPGKCTFCDRSVFGSRLRFFSAQYLLDEIDELSKRYKVKEVLFYDDTFVANKNRLHEFCNSLINRKKKLTWTCMARVNSLNYDDLKLMSKAGCWQIGYGIESGSQSVLDDLDKGITLEQSRNVLAWTRKAGINSKGYLMLGSPKETISTFNETQNFIKQLKLDSIHVSMFTPFPGSHIYNKLKDSNEFNEDWSKMNQWNPIYVPPGLRSEDMSLLLKKIITSFYFRPSVMFKFLMKFFKRPVLFIVYSSGIIDAIFYFFSKKGER